MAGNKINLCPSDHHKKKGSFGFLINRRCIHAIIWQTDKIIVLHTVYTGEDPFSMKSQKLLDLWNHNGGRGYLIPCSSHM